MARGGGGAPTLSQLLRLAGPLADVPGDARDRFRAFLAEAVTTVGVLREHIEAALAAGDAQHRRALQDLVNHCGRRCGFDVEFRPYRVLRDDGRLDGVWSLGQRLCVAIQLVEGAGDVEPAELNRRLDELQVSRRILEPRNLLGLYVTRPDEALVNAIAAALPAAGRLRVGSTDALLAIADVAHTFGPATGELVPLFRTTALSLAPGGGPAGRASPMARRRLVIVGRDRPGFFEHTRREFADGRTEVLLDRRIEQRRSTGTIRALDRRRGTDRRGRPQVDEQIRRLGYGIVMLDAVAARG